MFHVLNNKIIFFHSKCSVLNEAGAKMMTADIVFFFLLIHAQQFLKPGSQFLQSQHLPLLAELSNHFFILLNLCNWIFRDCIWPSWRNSRVLNPYQASGSTSPTLQNQNMSNCFITILQSFSLQLSCSKI